MTKTKQNKSPYSAEDVLDYAVPRKHNDIPTKFLGHGLCENMYHNRTATQSCRMSWSISECKWKYKAPNLPDCFRNDN